MRLASAVTLAACVLPQRFAPSPEPLCAPQTATSRRALLAVLLPAAAMPLPSFAETASPLTPSAMLTAGQWLNDLKRARNGVSELRPLVARGEDRDYEAVRVNIRKPPVNGIRKACSKVLMLLPENSPAFKEKNKVYEDIKKDLEELDAGCKPDLKTRPDLVALLSKFETDLESFGSGLGVAAADPQPAAAAPSALSAE